MELVKDCEIKVVENSQDNLIIKLLDEVRREVHTIRWRKQAYDATSRKYVPSDEKLEQVERWSQQILGLPLDEAEKAIGQRHDVYCYDTFDSLWKCDVKIPLDLVGEIFETTIESIDMDEQGIHIRYPYEDDTFATHMRFTEQVGNEYLPDPQKRKNKLRDFEEKFGVGIENKDSLIGQKIMVEIKSAFGKYPYGEIKNVPKKRKK